MKEINLTTTYTIFDNLKELSEESQNLFKETILARNQAYAPYSKFLVGCAILLENGVVITGNNQENAAYPSGLCAERVAIYYAAAKYPNVIIKKMFISAKSNNKVLDQPVAPCGSCRQSIAEYEIKQNQPIKLYFMGETGKIIKTNSLKELLPLGFNKKFL